MGWARRRSATRTSLVTRSARKYTASNKPVFKSARKNIAEHRVTLTILGAVAEFERTKIIERMMRGKLHKLRKGEIVYGQPPRV
jgi:DNA invertase Pin-like site-specific DNA recombinase